MLRGARPVRSVGQLPLAASLLPCAEEARGGGEEPPFTSTPLLRRSGRSVQGGGSRQRGSRAERGEGAEQRSGTAFRAGGRCLASPAAGEAGSSSARRRRAPPCACIYFCAFPGGFWKSERTKRGSFHRVKTMFMPFTCVLNLQGWQY